MGVRLAVCGKGLLGRLWLLVFSAVLSGLLAALFGVGIACLAAGSPGGPARWALMVGAFFLLLLLNVLYHFVVYPEVEVYDHGLLLKMPGRRTFVPWGRVVRVQEGPSRTRVFVRARLTPANRLLGLILRGPHPAFLMKRNHPGYLTARRFLADKLKREGRFVAAPYRS